MTTRKALVTGATGFIGRHLIRHLLRGKWQVHAIVRTKSARSVLDGESSLIVHEHTGSMDSMLSILTDTQPDVVFHLASLFISEHSSEDIDGLVQSNILFGTQLVEAMCQYGPLALVNTGTAWQHYQSRTYSPVNLYAASKQAFEVLIQYYIEAYGLRVITLKLTDTYGPEDPRPKLLNLLCQTAKCNEPLAMSSGKQLIDLVHAYDVAEAFRVAGLRLMATERQGQHERYSVSSGQPIVLRKLVNEIEKVTGWNLPIVWGGRADRKREVLRPWSGPSVPGWEAKISLREGLAEVIRKMDAD